jgi:MFS family permease
VAYGGFVAIGPEVIITRYGTDGLGTRVGTNFLSYGIGGLIGPPLAGWVADATNGRVAPICLVIGLVTIAVGFALRLDSRPAPRGTRAGH